MSGTARDGWFKSSYSSADSDNCVTVRIAAYHVGVKDSKNPDGSILIFSRGEWQAFIGGIKLGVARQPVDLVHDNEADFQLA